MEGHERRQDLLVTFMLRLMEARLPAAAWFALAVAVGCAQILHTVTDFVDGISPRNPVLDAIVVVFGFAIVVVYLIGLILEYIYLHVTRQPAAAAPPPPPPLEASLRRLAALACTFASVLLVVLAAFVLLLLGFGSPCSDDGGLTPT